MATQNEAPGATGWLGTPETAERLGITQRTLYRLIDTGQLPAFKMGRVLRVRVTDIDVFLESSRIKPGELRHLYPEPKGAAANADGADDANFGADD